MIPDERTHAHALAVSHLERHERRKRQHSERNGHVFDDGSVAHGFGSVLAEVSNLKTPFAFAMKGSRARLLL